MQIRQMFKRDINRYINGVVSVGDENDASQELREYVVTRELQRHFADFFEAYELGIDNPERNTGVWIQGYFGSGKSHFLKMLCYLLENKVVDGKSAVEYLEDKFEDPYTYARIKRVAELPAETILFNIDEKGGGYKEGSTSETAVLHSIARTFYDHLGFYGRDYKLARFEKMIDDKGATQAFRTAFKEITGEDWLESRDAYSFFGEEIAQAANQAAGLSINSITDWVNDTGAATIDIGELVDEINAYSLKRANELGKSFRLVFMIDEMGQYLNGDVSRMLNLQTLMEQFGDRCQGRVWMVVTSQEAIDEMMNVVSMDFSKIQGRFSTRLSLSSSSVDEVIKKRVLEKNDAAKAVLSQEYERNSTVLNNLFAFDDSRGDLRGYSSEDAFVSSYPFVGYQFTIMPSVLKEIRKHGYQGKSLSTGERSMLSSYQEAAQSVEEGTETALVPFWRFYDTLEKELDHGIKQVFERCRRAADEGLSLKPFDVNVLKVLYLINYINDIKPTAGNVAILLVDNMGCDMAALRVSVKESLDRLVQQNYVSRNGDRYSFLTDEEQDVAREIRSVQVDAASVTEEIKKIVFENIYKNRKYRKGANDYPVMRCIDGSPYGASGGTEGMELDVITLANDKLANTPDSELALQSVGKALLVLDTSNDYYEVLYNAARIAKYVRTQNVSALSSTRQNIIRAKQQEATTNRKEAVGLIEDAIVKARVAVDGKMIQAPATSASQKIDIMLDELADCTFTKAGFIDVPLADDGQLMKVLQGSINYSLDGKEQNFQAVAEVLRYLDARSRTHQSTTVGDIQRNFQSKPFGWREIDIAGVIAQLVTTQRATLSYGGARVQASDKKVAAYLRKSTEVDKVTVAKRQALPKALVTRSKALLRELDSSVVVPDNEDELVAAIEGCLKARKERFAELLRKNYDASGRYPGNSCLSEGVSLASDVLKEVADPESFLQAFCDAEDDLLDNAEDAEQVENFFTSNQREIFDDALSLFNQMHGREATYVEHVDGVQVPLSQIVTILNAEKPYSSIQKLPALVAQVRDAYASRTKAKQDDLVGKLKLAIDQIAGYATSAGAGLPEVEDIVSAAEKDKVTWEDKISRSHSCSDLDATLVQMRTWTRRQLALIDQAVESASMQKPPESNAVQQEPSPEPVVPAAPTIKVVSHVTALPPKVLHNEEEVDNYLAVAKKQLMDALKDASGVRLD